MVALLAAGPATAEDSDAEPAAETRHYDWMTNGVKSGSLVVHLTEGGRTRSSRFEFNDRGRGPGLTEVVSLATDGRITSLETSGHSYMGAPVDERMWLDAEGIHWSSTLEQGSSGRQDAWYLVNDGTPGMDAMLARALLGSPGGTLDLLPNGTASISKLTEFKPATPDNAPLLSLYAISGVDLGPRLIWLDGQGELFGLSDGSAGMVPTGWSHVLPDLKARQDKAEQAFHESRSRPLTHRLPAIYAITNVNVIDVANGTLLKDRVVKVADGRIIAVTTAEKTPDDVNTIDAGGGYLAPGLWDMHTHLSLGQGLLHLAGGVTSVRNMGAYNTDHYQSVHDRFASGAVLGPRTFPAGVVEAKSDFSAPLERLSTNQEEALELVRDYAGLGYPQIKIYSSVEPGWVSALASEAHALGMRVSGHVPAFMTAEQAVRAGFDEIQHINMVLLNFLAGPEDDTRTPLRFSLVAEKAGSLDLASKEVAAFIALLRDKNVVVDPTVSIFDNMFRHRSGQLSPSFAMVADHFPPTVRRGMLAGRMDIDNDNAALYASAADKLLETIDLLHRNGIQIVAGTDALPGFALHRELELYQAAGISPAEILKLATLGSAELMEAAEFSGSIEAGKQADMVLLGANPLEDVSAVRSVRLVFKGDRYYSASELYRAVGIEPFE